MEIEKVEVCQSTRLQLRRDDVLIVHMPDTLSPDGRLQIINGLSEGLSKHYGFDVKVYGVNQGVTFTVISALDAAAGVVAGELSDVPV